MIRLTFAALALLATASASAQSYTGRLEASDDTLTTGEYLDEYEVEAREGQEISAVVTSEAFDTYVILVSASGAQAEDDDCTDGETTRSCATLVADVDGTVRVLVTSFAVGEIGSYEVTVTVDGVTLAERAADGS